MKSTIAAMSALLEVLTQPACCIADGVLASANTAARDLMLRPGTPIADAVGMDPFDGIAYDGHAIRFSASLAGRKFDASIRRVRDIDVLVLQPREEKSPELRQLVKVSRSLRSPLGELFTAAHELFPFLESQEDPTIQHYTAQITRSLYQLLRLASNLSDAAFFLEGNPPIHRERLDLRLVLQELYDEAASLCATAGHELVFTCDLPHYYFRFDRAKVERAVLNLLSNAIRFATDSSPITLTLSRQGRTARITVRNQGGGVDPALLATVFDRFAQPASLHDTERGLGLGLTFVRRIAELHGGTVMLDSREADGVSVTMTLCSDDRIQVEHQLRSPILRYDPAGGYSHVLMELADVLPSDVFDSINLD